MKKSQQINFLSYGMACLIIALIIGLSVWQGQYGIDPHHWGLMLGNAIDLSSGMKPYSEVFIQYGILTTLIHVLGYKLFGGNLVSIIAITALFYGLGLVVIQKISEVLSGSKRVGIYALVLCFLFHPITIYPWANYICFPFLMGGIFLLLDSSGSSHKYLISSQSFRSLLAGALFGLACLAREGLFYAIVLIILSAILLSFLQTKNYKRTILLFISLLLGFALPISIFFSYLIYSDLVHDWYELAILLPRAYLATFFPHMASLYFWWPMLKKIVGGAFSFNIRWALILLIVLVNIHVLYCYLSYRFIKGSRYFSANPNVNENQVFIALSSLLLLSSSLHLVEIFRLATGTIVGVACLLSVNYLRSGLVKKLLLIAIPILLLLQITARNSGNYFFPSADKINNSVQIHSPAIFNGQRWSPEVANYYSQMSEVLNEIKGSQCPIVHHYNYTKDSFIDLISPFKRIQLPPFQMPKEFDFLNSKFNIKEKLVNPSDIVLFDSMDAGKLKDFTPPEGFYVFKHLSVPAFEFLPPNDELVIMIPKGCKVFLPSVN